ncbi:MAG: hypothetical protein ACLP8S_19400 [Solirubrobacteraceae bacterium]
MARVGPAPIDAWACAMGWAPVTARSHAARLTRAGWVERTSTKRGRGSLLFATRVGVQVAEVPALPAPEPAPTWWAHLAGCAWAAAWLTARDREMIGPRELLLDDAWSGELSVGSGRRVVHRPDLVGVVPGRRPAAIEVELARKSKARLRAILGLHARWIAAGRSGACVYVCGDEAIRELVVSQAALAGLRLEDGGLRVELLERIKELALAAGADALAETRMAGATR